jgi:predicted RNA binding protein YcfA (HicA-like mRNA interferase family)
MTKTVKALEKMRNNPRDWQLSELEIVARRFGITMRIGKGSHVTFTHPKWVDILTVPGSSTDKANICKKTCIIN